MKNQKKRIDEIIFEFENENKRRLDLNIDPIWAMDWDDITFSVAKHYGVSRIPSVANLVEKHSYHPNAQIIDNGLTVLQNLASKDRELIVASKGLSKYQFPPLKSLGLYNIFSGFLMPDLIGYIKTDSRFYKSYTTSSPNGIFISVGDHYIDDVVFPTSLGFFTVFKSSLPKLLTETNPFHRTNIMKKYRENINIPGFAENQSIFPTAIINRLQELPEVIDKIENSI